MVADRQLDGWPASGWTPPSCRRTHLDKELVEANFKGFGGHLPVRNLEVSRAFFAGLGFALSADVSGPDAACLVIGEEMRVVQLAEDRFRDCIDGDTSHIRATGEVLISVLASSEQEVDEIVTRAVVAGAKPWLVLDERPVYSESFQDPDGHLWQVACPRQPSCQEPAVPRDPIAA